MKFTKRDLLFSTVAGFITGFIAWRIFVFLNIPSLPIPWPGLMVIIPVLWIVGVNLGYLLGRIAPFFNQFGKFAAIGFTNASVDFGVLNLLISLSGQALGWYFTLFKAIAFIIATGNGYVFNKYWSFNAADTEGGSGEFLKYFVVSLAGLIVNVGVSSFVANVIGPSFGISPTPWANLSAVAGSAVAIVFTFVGFRFFVFRKAA